MSEIAKMFGVNTGSPYLLVFMDDGSGFSYNIASGVSIAIANQGTFSNDGPGDVAIWQGQIVLIVDPEKGYFRWPGAAASSNIPFVEIIPAPTVAVSGVGNVDIGSHQWAITFTVGGVETNLGMSSITLTLTVADQIQLTNVPVGPTGTTKRTVYRTKANQVGPFDKVADINDNTTTSYLDNTADSGLGAASPAVGAVTAGSHQWAVSFVDGSAVESALSDPSGPLSMGSANTVLVFSIPLGPAGTTKRKIYRTTNANPSTFFLVTTINDDTTTVYSDITADSGLGAAFAGESSNLVTQLDATKLGTTLAVFAGRVWIANNRTVQFTAPQSFTDFSISTAGGSFVMTDSNFIGPIRKLLTALDVMWIFGEAAINQLSNVSVIADTTTTTFSNINVSSSVGTIFPQSVISFLRQIEFATLYGIIQQVGVTPQRISEKIDGTYSRLDLTKPVTAGLVVLNDILCYGLMVTYFDPDNGGAPRKIILLVTFDGKWFIGSQGDDLVRMAHVEFNGQYRLFGADTNNIRELFVQPQYPIHKLKTPFFDGGDVTAGKDMVRTQMILHLPDPVAITSTITPQTALGPKRALTFDKSNVTQFEPAQGEAIQVWNGAGQIEFVGVGYQLQQWMIGMNSQLIGFDMSFDSDPFEICAYAIDVETLQSWGDGH